MEAVEIDTVVRHRDPREPRLRTWKVVHFRRSQGAPSANVVDGHDQAGVRVELPGEEQTVIVGQAHGPVFLGRFREGDGRPREGAGGRVPYGHKALRGTIGGPASLAPAFNV